MRSTWQVRLLAVLALAPACRCERAEDDEGSAIPPVTSAVPVALEAVPLFDTLRDARRSGQAEYRAPTPEEGAAYAAWVRAVAKAAFTDSLPTERPPEGFSGRLGGDGGLWLLQEQPTRKRGAGVVVLRPSRGAPVLVEAPHTFFDEDTLEIALLVFHGLGARALLINTMHRYSALPPAQRTDKGAREDAPSDVAHDPTAYFAVAHGVLIDVESSVTLQIHGFSDDTAPGVMAVVSAAKTSADVQAVARALRDALGDDRVRAYPDEIDVLGGTTNVEAKASRAHAVPFVHLELSRSLRRSLVTDSALAERFVSALRVVGERPK